MLYLEDHNEPGDGIDTIWVQLLDKDSLVTQAMSMAEPALDNAVEIEDGNIVVPH